jgi:hypothetical protein
MLFVNASLMPFALSVALHVPLLPCADDLPYSYIAMAISTYVQLNDKNPCYVALHAVSQ